MERAPATVEEFETDEVPSVMPTRTRSISTAVAKDSPRSSAELEEFTFPIGRTRSAEPVSLERRKRIEEVYDYLKNGGYFEGDKYAKEGLTKDIVEYIRGSSNWTFLHQAAFHNHTPAVEWLIKNGADRTIRGRYDGKTPYDVALTNGRAKGSTRILEMLEHRGSQFGGDPPIPER